MDYTASHFSISLPAGEGQGNIPALLRHLAKTLDALGSIDIRDIVFHGELDNEGEEWPSFTVYFDRVDAGE